MLTRRIPKMQKPQLLIFLLGINQFPPDYTATSLSFRMSTRPTRGCSSYRRKWRCGKITTSMSTCVGQKRTIWRAQTHNWNNKLTSCREVFRSVCDVPSTYIVGLPPFMFFFHAIPSSLPVFVLSQNPSGNPRLQCSVVFDIRGTSLYVSL